MCETKNGKIFQASQIIGGLVLKWKNTDELFLVATQTFELKRCLYGIWRFTELSAIATHVKYAGMREIDEPILNAKKWQTILGKNTPSERMHAYYIFKNI